MSGGGGSSGGTTTVNYYAGLAFLLCEGPIQGVGAIWAANSSTGVTAASLGLSIFDGTYPQTGWSYLLNYGQMEEVHTIPSDAPYIVTVDYTGAPFTNYGVKDYAGNPFTLVSTPTAQWQYSQTGGSYTFDSADAGRDATFFYTAGNQAPSSQALGYNGFAYVANSNYSLGTSAQLPNHNIEVMGFYSNSVTGSLDADPSLFVVDLLTNPHWGIVPAFNSAWVGSMSEYQSYCLAQGLLISACYDTAQTAAQVLADVATYTNSDVAWTGSTLKLIPRGDSNLTGNGATYVPPSFTFHLDDDDWLENNSATTSSGSSSHDPLVLTRTRRKDMVNQITIEIQDRANGYNPFPVVARDQAAIETYGLNAKQTQQAHIIASAAIARTSAQLMLQRAQIANIYQGTVAAYAIAIDVGDLGTISSATLGVSNIPVRCTEITEQMDGALLLAFEEVLDGSGTAANHTWAISKASGTDFNVDPGLSIAPIIFDAPPAIATSGLEVWLGTSGGANWGGCQVWISSDNQNYRLAGTIHTKAAMGILTATLGLGADPDTVNTLAVDLTESGGSLTSATSTTDADLYRTLCYVDGELVSYETATLTATSKYSLSYLRRGAYGTTIAAHASGASFLRLNGAILKIPYTKDQIGQTIYVKLLPFNVYGSALYELNQVSPVTHVIQGPPPPPNVTGFTVQQNGGAVAFNWDAIKDYALKGVDITVGPAGTTDWAAMTMLTEAAAGTEMTNASVSPGNWTFGIRARDIADQLSPVMATVTMVVVNESTVISQADQAPAWGGTLSGFVEHYTGVLIPDSTLLADQVTAIQAETWLPSPVPSSTYVSPVIDTAVVDSLRLYANILGGLGPSGAGNVDTALFVNYSVDNVTWSGWMPWTMGIVTARYVQMKLVQSNAGGPCIITGFTPVIDVNDKSQTLSIVAAAGGTVIAFDQPFHDIPLVQATPTGTGMTGASAANVTVTGCTIHGWTGSADTGGSVNVNITGP